MANSDFFQGSASSGSLLVSDQPYAAEEEEDGFLPVAMNRGEATINQYIDEQHRQENLWESADVVEYDEEEQDYTDEEEEEEQLEEESGAMFGVMTEPDLDREGVLVKDSDLFEEDGSGFVIQEESEEEEEEEEGFEGEDEIHLNQKEAEVLRHRSQVEEMLRSEVGLQSEPLVSEGEEDNRRQTGRGEEDDGMIASEVEWNNDEDLVDDGEMTWYFTWR